MLKVESDLRGGLITRIRIKLQTMQDDFLQPVRKIRPPPAWRHRVIIETLPPLPYCRGVAKRPLVGGEEIHQYPEREDVAARVVADTGELLRRNIKASSDRPVELFGGEIRRRTASR